MDREALIRQLIVDEGLRLRPYFDTQGKFTVGVGRNLSGKGLSAAEARAVLADWGEDPSAVNEDRLTVVALALIRNKGVTVERALAFLDRDVDDAVHDLDTHLPWWKKLDDERQAVMANMSFNLGISRLLGFREFLTQAQLGNWGGAAMEMLDSLWARQVGGRATRLANIMRAAPIPNGGGEEGPRNA